MKILNSSQIKEVDAYTIKNEPIHSVNLMERAARVCTNWITNRFDVTNKIKIFAGPGNNGGDAFAIARLLADRNYQVKVFTISEKYSETATINYDKLKSYERISITNLQSEIDLPVILPTDLVIDGLYGSGLTRVLAGFPAKVVQHINKSKATVISIDIPSGLFSEENEEMRSYLLKPNSYRYLNAPEESNDYAIHATYTLTLELPYFTFFFPETEIYVGEWYILPIGLSKEALENSETTRFYLTQEVAKKRLIKRKKFSHKGVFGHALLITGSYGKMGAAVLSSKACLRSGVGLLTTHIPRLGHEIMQTAVPEVMLSIDKYDKVMSSVPNINNYSVIGVGPGIGKSNSTHSAIREILEKTTVPIVFDADAINIIAENPEFMDKIPANSIFTPHPKEFERLVGRSEDSFERHRLQKEFAERHNCYVVLKGAHTCIACPNGVVYFNSTGNPGMATGGSGDVLTGLILSLLSQGYSSESAALLGVYLHGLAGDIAAAIMSEEAVTASDLVDNIGKAILNLRNS